MTSFFSVFILVAKICLIYKLLTSCIKEFIFFKNRIHVCKVTDLSNGTTMEIRVRFLCCYPWIFVAWHATIKIKYTYFDKHFNDIFLLLLITQNIKCKLLKCLFVFDMLYSMYNALYSELTIRTVKNDHDWQLLICPSSLPHTNSLKHMLRISRTMAVYS